MSYPIVDYLSFSVDIPQLLYQWDIAATQQIPFNVDDRVYDLCELMARQKNYSVVKSSGLLNSGYRFPDIGMTYMQGDKCNVSLIQFSGSGCEWLRSSDLLETVMETWIDRTTRLDIAIDFETSTEPEDFARSFSNRRFKISAHEDSNSGSTWYVGSYKSDRFARIYRYREPLPRHNQLRLEYQFSDGAAKQTAAMCLNEGILSVAQQAGKLFGWNHPSYDLSHADNKLSSTPRNNTKAGTQYWLYKQVLPSLIKSAQKGDIKILIDFESKLRDIISEYIDFKGEN